MKKRIKLKKHRRKLFSGFTLIELLIVIVIIAALAVAVFIALNPTKRLQDARNARRITDIESIRQAINQYVVDKGILPAGLTAGMQETQIGTSNGTGIGANNVSCVNTTGSCNAASQSCVDLTAPLANYLKSIPKDPKTGSASATGYSISVGANSSVTVNQCGTEQGTLAQARDPLKQPFASTSIWNMPIGSGAIYVPANLPANPGPDNWTPMPQIDDEHIVLRPTAPLTVINYNNNVWSGASRCNATGGSGGNLPVSVPIPANYVIPSDNTNSSASFLMPDGRTIVQTQPLTICTAGGPATSNIKEPNADLYGDGIIGSHGGSEMSAFGGSIRMGELRPGQQGPHHAVKLEFDSTQALYRCTVYTDCFRWPALVADSGAVGDYGTQTNNQNTAMKMGALLAIPASVDINSLGLESEPGRELAWTLQNYGAYIVDSTGGPSYQLNAENGPDGNKRTEFQADYGYPLEERINSNTPWSRDFQRLMTALYVINNNSPTSIGGGGTPRQPLASPISP